VLLDQPNPGNGLGAGPAAPNQQPPQAVMLPNGQIIQPNPNPQPPAPAKMVAAPIPTYRLELFGRWPVSDKNPAETGKLDYLETIENPAGILPTWLGVDGGFYYLTADNTLHILEGSLSQK
jgi:hypothetical protein